ncbi:MAG: FAD synthase [Candidatus Latescibacteria bacterium]|nr:FAD synthase [Candidatus Latescibacterota bacterium]
MGRVLSCGTFDHLHPGHLSFLRQAAALGTELVVVVARDENVRRIKGRRPDHGEDERRTRVEALGIASQVRLGYPGMDFLKIVAEIQPQIIALGYDQQPPPGLQEAFPQIQLVVLKPYYPEKYKSSFFRISTPGPGSDGLSAV